ncbi:Polygalacturonase [Reichenbachiella agariperforans]|uniref:Polygalacturonase n=1 Tax=Reichenbachiella agariperforans TaxID=156994 RepID=A0A1M6UX48_REIAG|nr:glycoside hydrolase family 28 protein [Reichenbachiella agariperforans]SHK73733.1 Polygalacturonase [Reichenbachiella agariperforans]
MIRLLTTALLLCCFAQSQGQPSETKAAIDGILSEISVPTFPSYTTKVTRFGAKGDSISDDHLAFAKAMAACKKKGGGTIVVPAGTYTLHGPIHFVSNVRLHLDQGAKIRFSSNPADYLPMVITSWEGTMLYNYSPMIYAYQAENIAITGEGTIDGEGHLWMDWKQKEQADKQHSRDMNHASTPITERQFGEGHYLRPQLLQFFDCKNILIEGIHVEDSPFWCLHMLRCSNITMRGLSYDAHNKNNDGIDLEYSRNVLIEDIDFNNADDNIAIKAGRDHEGRANSITPSENIVVRNCRFQGLHALVVGSEMAAGVRNVYVQDCQASGYLKRGIYLKTNTDRGGYIQNIHMDRVSLLEVEDCFYITSNYHNEGSGEYPSQVSDIYISNVTCQSANQSAIVIQGHPDKKIKNIQLRNIKVKEAKYGLSITDALDVTLEEIIVGKDITAPTSVH